MVVNEKALVRQMKEAYKNQGYTVAVSSDLMIIAAGFWLVQIEMANVPNELLSLIALHMRTIPGAGDAYKVNKGADGPIVQKKLIDDALGGALEMEKELAASFDNDGPVKMQKTNLRYDGCGVWQAEIGLGIFLIDPRYEALIASDAEVKMVGNGIYADGNVSKVWVLRVDKRSDAAQLKHLAGIRWVAM